MDRTPVCFLSSGDTATVSFISHAPYMLTFTVLKKQPVDGTSSGWSTENRKAFLEVDQSIHICFCLSDYSLLLCMFMVLASLWSLSVCKHTGHSTVVEVRGQPLDSALSVQFYTGSENQTQRVRTGAASSFTHEVILLDFCFP